MEFFHRFSWKRFSLVSFAAVFIAIMALLCGATMQQPTAQMDADVLADNIMMEPIAGFDIIPAAVAECSGCHQPPLNNPSVAQEAANYYNMDEESGLVAANFTAHQPINTSRCDISDNYPYTVRDGPDSRLSELGYIADTVEMTLAQRLDAVNTEYPLKTNV